MSKNQFGKFNEIIDKELFKEEEALIYQSLKPQFIKTYMGFAETMAKGLSYCQRAKVGSLIITPENEMLMGYNGTPSGFDNICELPNQDVTDPRTLHSEPNSITKAARSTLQIKNSSMFVTLQPCLECSKLIVQSGVRRVFFKENYRLTDGLEFLTDVRTGVQVIELDDDFNIKKIHNRFSPILDIESKYLKSEIDELRKELEEQKALIDKLTNKLK